MVTNLPALAPPEPFAPELEPVPDDDDEEEAVAFCLGLPVSPPAAPAAGAGCAWGAGAGCAAGAAAIPPHAAMA